MADMQSGIGPFLGVYLQGHGWSSGLIGTVLTIGAIAGMLMTAPAGALIDGTKSKRAYVIGCGIATLLASGLVLISKDFWVVALSQVATSIAGATIVPAVTGITLGIVRQKGFNRQNGRNQAFNHAGNAVGAALSGYLGYKYGFTAVFYLAAGFGVVTMFCTLMIPRKAINDRAARGMKKEDDDDDNEVSGVSVLLKCKPLLILASALALFHMGNAAMLPLYGMAVTAASPDKTNGADFVALTIVIAQVSMIVMSVLGMRVAEKHGYWHILLISFLALPLRGILASQWIGALGVYPVQILDGVGAGLQSVAVPGLVARILNGTGRVNVGQGALMTVQSLGASVSPALGGWMAQYLGYPITFATLGAIAIGSVVIWIAFRDHLNFDDQGKQVRSRA